MLKLPLWVKAVAVLAILGAIGAGVKAIYDRGYDARDAEAKAEEQRIKNDALERFNRAAATAREREQKLLDDLNTQSTQRYEDMQNHEKTVNALRARARAGELRLRVDVAPGSLPGCAPASGIGFTARPRDETRADLMPAITDAVLRLAADSARDVRRYNDLVDRYNAAVELCNAGTD